MRRISHLLLALLLIAGVGCPGGGSPPTTEQCSWIAVGTFAPGDVIPGFTLAKPTGGRADVFANGTWSSGTWTVMFTRSVAGTSGGTDDVDFTNLATGTTYPFSVAVMDNSGGAFDDTMQGQHAAPYTLGNEASSANLKAKSVTTAPTPYSGDSNWGAAFTKPAGAGISGTASAAAVTLRAAYTTSFVYVLAAWSDATKDDLKQSWYFDGTTWTRRKDKGNDNSWATIDADGSQWDEDRLAIWWNISASNFTTQGCLALCHEQRMGSLTAGQKADLWHWKAARSNPLGFVDDQRLNDGTWSGIAMAGRSNDTGSGFDSNNISGSLPTYMSELDPGVNARYLISGQLTYDTETTPLAGTPVIYDMLPGFRFKTPTVDRADVRTVGTWSNGVWTVLFTRSTAGTSPGTSDVDFTNLATGSLHYFSVAVLDNMGGAADGTMTSQYAGVLTMGDETLQPTANLRARRGTSAPSRDPDDSKWGPSFLKPVGSGISGTATAAAATLRAAYDSTNFYLLAVWSDATESDLKQSWVYNGSAWVQRSDKGTDGSWATIDANGSQWDEDRIAIWWNISASNFNTNGCLALCHSERMGSLTQGEKADLWHWKAARTNPMGYADDQRLNDGTWGSVTMAGRSDDAGTGMTDNNTGDRMASAGINANVKFLFQSGVTSASPPAVSWKPVTFVSSLPTKLCITAEVPMVGTAGATVSYSQQIAPLFASNCACHRNGNSQNGLNLDTYANLIKGGNSGSEVVAGNGAGSLIYKKVSMDSPPVGARMPFGGPYLSAAQQQLIKDWIDQGALNN